MTISAGSRLGPYEVLSPLGAGGMGEVYRARDPRLGREVAIKVLPAAFSQDPERLRRFEQEARAAGVLNHPNLTAVYDIGTHDGAPYVVQELLEGETLRSTLAGGRLPPRKAIDYALQIAHGLAAAHEKGIVHRDLKPENVFVTRDGRVKILDFGLAKLTHHEEGGPVTSLPTAAAGTDPGVVLGTLGYMSPEQLRGHSADARSDIFSFGAVFYELLSGKRAFRGDSAADTISAILKEDPPDLSITNQSISPALERIVRHCLEKNPEQRFHSAHDVAFALSALPDSSLPRPAEQPEGASSRRPSRVWLAVAVALAVVAAAGIGILQRTRARTIDSLAVLPFTNGSGDPNVDYLSDGITESLTNTLAQLPRLRVTARTIAARYKGRETDPQKAGRELGATAVVSGKVLQRGDTLTVQADLVDVGTGSQLWGDHYSRKMTDMLAIQDEIAKEISEKLRPRLTGEEKKRLAKGRTENAEAFQFYLKGRYAWEKRTDESLKKSLEYFEQAIDKDPGYALAYSGLADSYAVLAINGISAPGAAFPKAVAAAKKALEIDSDLAQPHATLGWALFTYEWSYDSAEREFKTALALDPSYATAHHWYGLLLSARGRSDEAIAELQRATQADPFSYVMRLNTLRVLVNARQFDLAIEKASKVIEANPDKAAGYARMGSALEAKGMLPEAAAAYEKTAGKSGSGKEFNLARAFALSGRRVEAKRLLEEYQRGGDQGYIAPFDVARIHKDLGEKDQMFEWLEKAYVDRSSELVFLKVNPYFDDVRSDPRFVDLVRRLKLSS